MNYKELGLKVGLEFHQRLDTDKLFCNCSSEPEEKIKSTVMRKLRPTAGEMGEIDASALLESARDKTFKYQSFENASCLVELDEEPPHEINEKALDTAVEISLLLDCNVPDEIHVMRKTVIDGSNTGGFQRTMLVGNDGSIETPFGLVGILGVFLEEEACGIVEEKNGVKTYRLDRLGVPLIEIATDVMEFEPKQVQEVALRIGRLLRVTGKVKRGIGTIRQDVNISIEEGARVEAKGVQDIKLVDKIIEYEVMRQSNLLELMGELKSRKIKKQNYDVQSFTSFFEKTQSKIIKTGLEKNQKVHGIVLHDFKGIMGFELSPGKRFGSELAGIAKSFGLGGLIHTDEDLSKYNIEKEIAEIYKKHNLKENDSLILVIGEPSIVANVLDVVSKRINLAFECIPNETRKALEDGNTQFMRFLSGAHRMYPETDVPPVVITQHKIKEIENQLPEKPEKVYEKLVKDFSLGEELADKMISSKNIKLFFELVKTKVNPTLIATVLEETLVEIRREGFDVSLITEKHLHDVFSFVAEEKIAKEAVPEILKKIAEKPESEAGRFLKNFEAVSEDEMKKTLGEIVNNNKNIMDDKRKAFSVLMGEMMKKYRGKADGALIAKLVKERI